MLARRRVRATPRTRARAGLGFELCRRAPTPSNCCRRCPCSRGWHRATSRSSPTSPSRAAGRAGEVVFREGDEGDTCYVVRTRRGAGHPQPQRRPRDHAGRAAARRHLRRARHVGRRDPLGHRRGARGHDRGGAARRRRPAAARRAARDRGEAARASSPPACAPPTSASRASRSRPSPAGWRPCSSGRSRRGSARAPPSATS